MAPGFLKRIWRVGMPSSLRWQLVALVCVIVAGSISVFSWHALQEESNRTAAAMRRQALVHAENIASPSVDYVFARDFASLETLLLRAARFPAITDIQVCDADGRLYADVVRKAGQQPAPRFGQPALSPPLSSKAEIVVDNRMMVVWSPIYSGNLKLGWVRTAYSLDDIVATRHRILTENAKDGGAVVVVALLFLVMFLRRPLTTVARYTQFADRLNETRGKQVMVDESSSELSKLGAALNAASTRLAVQDHDLQKILRDLESQKLALDEHCIVCITDTHGKIVYVNGRFCEISQYSKQELLGRAFVQLESGSYSQAFHDDRESTCAQGMVWNAEMEYRKKDGGTFWVDKTVVPFKDDAGRPYQFVSIMTDITDRKSAAEELERLAAFAENNPNMVLSINYEGEVQYQNPAVRETLSILELDVPTVSVLLPADIRETVKECIRDQTTRRGIEVSAHGRTLLWTLAPISGQKFVHCYATEITKRKQAEEAAKLALVEKLTAQAATRAKSTFLANMSHEIRTPLTAIVGFAESLLDSGQSLSERLASINSIQRNGRHLLQIINDILDLSKIEADRLEIEQIRMSPFDLVDDLRTLIDLQVQAKGLALDVEYILPLPKTIESDPLRLKQALLNLCSNAIKFTKKGGIRICIHAEVANEKIYFDVIDSGIGLTPAQQARIFAPFSQADSSTTREYGGTGLGLYLVKQLSEKLGGCVSLQSAVDTGSCFSLSVATGPLADVELVHDIESVPIATLPVASPVNEMLSGTVLLAEDNPDNQRLISMYIRRTGADVVIAENGERAVELALSGRFNLVLMDMQMPVMDGLEATRMLRAKGYGGEIIALTANAMREDMDACIRAGCNDFLTKPINRELFSKMLTQYLRPVAKSLQPDEPIVSSLLDSEPDFLDLVVKFAARLPDMVEDIRKALTDADWPAVKKSAHDLKAVGGGYGYPQISEVAAKIEFEVAKRDAAAAAPLIAELSTLADRIVQGVASNAPNVSSGQVRAH